MLPICGEPLLAYTLRYLAHYGFDQIAINLHFKSKMIIEYLGDGSRFNVMLHYSHEDVPLGTAGAIKQLEEYFSDVEDFLVLYGDLLIDQDLTSFMDFHYSKQAFATLLVHQRGRSNSLVRMDESNRVTGFIERPTEAEQQTTSIPWVNSGLQALNRRVLQYISEGKPADLPRDVYMHLLDQEVIFGFPLTGYRCAIDSVERYKEAQRAIADGQYSIIYG